jgi:hypothetical protein
VPSLPNIDVPPIAPAVMPTAGETAGRCAAPMGSIISRAHVHSLSVAVAASRSPR